MAVKTLWAEKYRPKTLENYVFQNPQHKSQFEKMIAEGEVPHLLLTGTQGSGKTTIGDILINELKIDDADVLRINASNQTGVDFVRDIILNFAGSYPIGKLKIIRLEEFDYMSLQAQGMLRAVMEDNSDTCRFICSCNFEHKIIVPLKSRFQHMRFTAPNKDEVTLRMAEILLAEEVSFEIEELDKYVSQAYPDLRKIINNMQLNTIDKKLGSPVHDAEGADYQFKLLDLIIAGNIRELRKLVSEQCTTEQLTDVYEFLYKNIHKNPKFAKQEVFENAMMILADGVYKHGITAIPHLNFDSTCYKLAQAAS